MTFTIPVWLLWLLGVVVGVPVVLFIVFLFWVGAAIFFGSQFDDGSWWR